MDVLENMGITRLSAEFMRLLEEIVQKIREWQIVYWVYEVIGGSTIKSQIINKSVEKLNSSHCQTHIFTDNGYFLEDTQLGWST